jgi:hypothetical protein
MYETDRKELLYFLVLVYQGTEAQKKKTEAMLQSQHGMNKNQAMMEQITIESVLRGLDVMGQKAANAFMRIENRNIRDVKLEEYITFH